MRLSNSPAIKPAECPIRQCIIDAITTNKIAPAQLKTCLVELQ